MNVQKIMIKKRIIKKGKVNKMTKEKLIDLIIKKCHCSRFNCVGSTDLKDYSIFLDDLFKILEIDIKLFYDKEKEVIEWKKKNS